MLKIKKIVSVWCFYVNCENLFSDKFWQFNAWRLTKIIRNCFFSLETHIRFESVARPKCLVTDYDSHFPMNHIFVQKDMHFYLKKTCNEIEHRFLLWADVPNHIGTQFWQTKQSSCARKQLMTITAADAFQYSLNFWSRDISILVYIQLKLKLGIAR